MFFLVNASFYLLLYLDLYVLGDDACIRFSNKGEVRHV